MSKLTKKGSEAEESIASDGTSKKDHCIDFHGATFIDKVGQEVEITEEMVEEACQQILTTAK